MVLQWKIKIIKPIKALNIYAEEAWGRTMPEIEKWMRDDLIMSLVYGGNGIVGVAQTDFYKFITSPRGLSELGIEASEPPKLLKAYMTSAFNIKIFQRRIVLQFGNYAKLYAATPHPADGTGNLRINSWLEWVDGLEVATRGFVPRNQLSGQATKSIRLGNPLGGLMLPRGVYRSTGLWKFPAALRAYEDKWFMQNIQAIEKLLTDKMLALFIIKLTS